MGQGTVSKTKKGNHEPRILITGSYYSGKRTLMEKLESTRETPDSSEALSASTGKSSSPDFNFTSLDLGGRDTVRPMFRYFCSQLEAVVFLVDTVQDKEILSGFFKDQLQDIMEEKGAKRLPVLILANKQALPEALTCQQVLEELDLDLDTVRRKRVMDILPLSLETGEGLSEVRDWLERQRKKKQLHAAIVEPVEKAVPPAVTSSCVNMSSALKQAFGMMRKKLSVHS